MNYWGSIIICVIFVVAMKFLEKYADELKKKKPDTTDYSKAYQARNLLTKNEWSNYMKMREAAEAKGLMICPKVRLLDLVEPKKGEDYKKLLNKVQSKHVDFVICDKSLHIKAIVELDDSSHDTKDRQERDKFVNAVLSGVGHKVIHTRSVTPDIFNDL